MPNIIHPDEPFIQLRSWELLYNIFSKGDFNPHTFKYGPLTFYLNAIFSLPVFIYSFLSQLLNTFLNTKSFFEGITFYTLYDNTIYKYGNVLLFLGRFKSVVFGTLSVYLVYLSTKYLLNRNSALIAALFFAISPIHVRDSHFLTNDITALMFDLISFYFILKIVKEKKINHVIIAGIISGFSATIRYFPISVLLMGLAVFISLFDSRQKIKMIIYSIISILLGVAIGMPFLLIEKNGFGIFMEDLKRYALPWYGTGFTSFFFSVLSFIFSLGKNSFPSFKMLEPTQGHWFYLNYLIFHGYGFFVLILSVMGFLKLALKKFSSFLIIATIPVFTFIYFVFYIPTFAMPYEKNIIPMIPFLCIAAGYFLSDIKKRTLFLIVPLIILQPLLNSFSASISCSKMMIQKEAAEWIKENISDGKRVANFPLIFFPSGINFERLDSFDQPSKTFGLAEIGRQNYDYIFINAGRMDYETYRIFADFVIPRSLWYRNSYYYLALAEYASEGNLLKSIDRCQICDSTRIYFFELKKNDEKNFNKRKNIFKFDFEDPLDINKWVVYTYKSENNILKIAKNEEFDDGYSMRYIKNGKSLVSPRVMSGKFKVKPDTNYEISFKVKNNKILNEQKIFARIDYYNYITSEGFMQKIKNVGLFLATGMQTKYFEKLFFTNKAYNNVAFPGVKTSLSSRINIEDDWQNVKIVSKSPSEEVFAVISFQLFDANDADVSIDDISLNEIY